MRTLLGHEVSGRKPQRRHKAHRGFARRLGLATRGLCYIKGVGIVGNLAVRQVDDARGVLVRQLRIMRDHNNQTVARHVLEQVHDLHGRCGIQSAGRLVGQHNLGIVDQSTGDGHALHLSARKLARALVNVLAQADFLQRLARTLAALGMPHARERERQLHVFQNGLMQNEVIALEHKADAVVAIGVPIAVVKVLSRNTVDQQVARVKVVESADNVEHRGFTRTRGTQNGHELVVAKRQAYVVERHLRKRLRNVPFANSFELQHGRQPLLRRHPARSPPPFVFDAFVLLYPHFLPAPVRNVTEPHQKTNGTAPKRRGPERDLYMVELVLKGSGLLRTATRDPRYALRVFLLLAIRNRLVDKLVERCALLGGADGSHDWIPYDVAILIDDIRCREREQI